MSNCQFDQKKVVVPVWLLVSSLAALKSPSVAHASVPTILGCKLTMDLVPNEFKPGDLLISGKKVESKQSTLVTFVGLDSGKPRAKSDLFKIAGSLEQQVQLLNRDRDRITLGFFKAAAPMIFDIYFPKEGKSFVWLHILTAHYVAYNSPRLDSASWGECD